MAAFLVVSVVLITVVYLNSLSLRGPFLFDYMQNIKDNVFMRLDRFPRQDLMDAAFKSMCRNRPVTDISFAFWTYGRNAVWVEEVVSCRDNVEKSPNKARRSRCGFVEGRMHR